MEGDGNEGIRRQRLPRPRWSRDLRQDTIDGRSIAARGDAGEGQGAAVQPNRRDSAVGGGALCIYRRQAGGSTVPRGGAGEDRGMARMGMCGATGSTRGRR